MAFADFSLFVTALDHTYESTGNHYVTLHFNMDFIGSSKAGALIEAAGTVEKVSSDGQIVIVSSQLHQGDRKLAVFRAVLKMLGKPSSKPSKL